MGAVFKETPIKRLSEASLRTWICRFSSYYHYFASGGNLNLLKTNVSCFLLFPTVLVRLLLTSIGIQVPFINSWRWPEPSVASVITRCVPFFGCEGFLAPYLAATYMHVLLGIIAGW